MNDEASPKTEEVDVDAPKTPKKKGPPKAKTWNQDQFGRPLKRNK